MMVNIRKNVVFLRYTQALLIMTIRVDIDTEMNIYGTR